MIEKIRKRLDRWDLEMFRSFVRENVFSPFTRLIQALI